MPGKHALSLVLRETDTAAAGSAGKAMAPPEVNIKKPSLRFLRHNIHVHPTYIYASNIVTYDY